MGPPCIELALTTHNSHAEYLYRSTTYEFQPVPEPLSLVTVGTGMGVLRWRTRRAIVAKSSGGVAGALAGAVRAARGLGEFGV